MSDPFEALREPRVPVDPDPAFAHRLRARVERALALPRGVVPLSALSVVTEEAVTAAAAVPYLAVADARAALAWYVDVFEASVVGEPVELPDGRIGHAELRIGRGVLYLADAHPELGVTAPRPGEASVSLMLAVDDADAVRARALAAGASGERAPYDGYGQRMAWIVDPFGHRWGLSSPLPERIAYRHGDVVYVSLWLPDAGRAADFYAGVLGWGYELRGAERGRVRGAAPTVGLHSTAGVPTLFCCYAVDDLDAARAAVHAAGGEAGEPEREPFGLVAGCTDDQGTAFALFQLEGEPGGAEPAPNGVRSGDLGYLTLQVVDAARARAFYGAVLGWRFTPGRVIDGWNVEGPRPMIGLAGGAAQARAVPQWRVSDVDAAVARVRSNGGTSSDPQDHPYGRAAEAVDDQGTEFGLVRM